MALIIRNEENVTVVGKNTIGADGAVSLVYLPCGDVIQFTATGFESAECEQIQRLGIAPDIIVKPTIEGLTQGKDEILEYAINLLNQ